MEIIIKPNLLIFVILYGILMVFIGIKYSKKISSSDEFVLADRSLGSLVLVGTLLATWCGSGAITGGETAISFTHGFKASLIMGSANVVGIVILALLSGKIRAYGKYTIAGIIEEKYGNIAQVFASIVIVLSYVGILSYQFKGLGYILNVTTGVPVEIGTLIGTIMIIFLALSGGLLSVAYTDAISAIIMIIGIYLTIPFMYVKLGGISNIIANLPPENVSGVGTLTPIQMVSYIIPTLVLLLSDQNMFQRLSAGKDKQSVKKAVAGWLVAIIVTVPGLAFIGFMARSVFTNITSDLSIIATATYLPTFFGGLLLTASTAFIITTGNSFLLSASTNITYDIYRKFINQNATDKQLLNVTRISIIILGIAAFSIFNFFPTILSLQMFAYTIYGASITPAIIGAIVWKKVTAIGGLSSMIAGFLATLVWEWVLNIPFGINSALISVPVAIIVLIVVSLLTQKNNQKLAL